MQGQVSCPWALSVPLSPHSGIWDVGRSTTGWPGVLHVCLEVPRAEGERFCCLGGSTCPIPRDGSPLLELHHSDVGPCSSPGQGMLFLVGCAPGKASVCSECNQKWRVTMTLHDMLFLLPSLRRPAAGEPFPHGAGGSAALKKSFFALEATP